MSEEGRRRTVVLGAIYKLLLKSDVDDWVKYDVIKNEFCDGAKKDE